MRHACGHICNVGGLSLVPVQTSVPVARLLLQQPLRLRAGVCAWHTHAHTRVPSHADAQESLFASMHALARSKGNDCWQYAYGQVSGRWWHRTLVDWCTWARSDCRHCGHATAAKRMLSLPAAAQLREAPARSPARPPEPSTRRLSVRRADFRGSTCPHRVQQPTNINRPHLLLQIVLEGLVALFIIFNPSRQFWVIDSDLFVWRILRWFTFREPVAGAGGDC